MIGNCVLKKARPGSGSGRRLQGQVRVGLRPSGQPASSGFGDTTGGISSRLELRCAAVGGGIAANGSRDDQGYRANARHTHQAFIDGCVVVGCAADLRYGRRCGRHIARLVEVARGQPRTLSIHRTDAAGRATSIQRKSKFPRARRLRVPQSPRHRGRPDCSNRQLPYIRGPGLDGSSAVFRECGWPSQSERPQSHCVNDRTCHRSVPRTRQSSPLTTELARGCGYCEIGLTRAPGASWSFRKATHRLWSDIRLAASLQGRQETRSGTGSISPGVSS